VRAMAGFCNQIGVTIHSDNSVTGWFNPTSRQFEELPDRYRLEVKDGLAIAKNEKAPNLVMLPVPGPEVAQ